MTQAGFQDGPSNSNLLSYWSSRKDWPKKMALSKSYIDSWCASNYSGRQSWKQQFYMCNMQWHPTPVLLPGQSHGRRSLVGCSPWGRGESDTTERLHYHFLLSCIGEGNGNPLQCSCLENPRDSRAWWAAIYGVAQSQTLLKQLSSSSINSYSIPGSSNSCGRENLMDLAGLLTWANSER